MRQKDFINIIDLKAEFKEYSCFDKGRSKTYTTYTEWDTHMKDLFLTIESQTDMYNLKYYCVDVVRPNAIVHRLFGHI